MIQQQLNKKYSALKIPGMNIQMMRSTWEILVLAVAAVWEKGFPWNFFFCQGQESGLVFLCELCLKLHNHLVIDIIM